LHIQRVPIHTPGVSYCLRLSLCVLAALAVWLLTGSARAAAPQCDARGATTFAPNPTLEEPNASVDIGQADDCSGASTDDLAYRHGRSSSASSAQEEAPQSAPPRILVVHRATPTGISPQTSVAATLSRNERDRLERPPR
jgi:hypothetical protein